MIDLQPMALAELVAAGVGLLQCALIWGGLKQLRRTSESGDRQMDQQHRETMRALEALIKRTGSSSATS